MKNCPEHIRKIIRRLTLPGNAVIVVKVPEWAPRVCDYCDDILVDENGITIKKAHLTDYGLMCDSCIGSIKPLATYSEGQSVYYEKWYQDGIERD